MFPLLKDLRRVLLRSNILQGRQQRQWNSVDETACAEYFGRVDRSLMNIVPKQQTLSDFLQHTMTKNETSNVKRLVSN